MTKSPKSPEAKERLAAALRENLKRRKAQARQAARPAAGEAAEAPKPVPPADSDRPA